MKYILLSAILMVCFGTICSDRHNKYSKEANQAKPQRDDKQSDEKIFENLHRPFRMAKLNLVWAKAQHRLTEPKLKSLYTELKMHDKEELNWKQMHAENDKDGLKEASLRKKLLLILNNYGLTNVVDEKEENDSKKGKNGEQRDKSKNQRNKGLFKDKKLNSLWEKAESAGFTPEELQQLKKEFTHYQDKVDLYYNLVDTMDEQSKNDFENAINEDELDVYNEVNSDVQTKQKHDDFVSNANLLRDQHHDLKESYDQLEKIAIRDANNYEFENVKVQVLWQNAVDGKFTAEELASLKVELLHYESRLMKLRHLYAEHAITNEKYKNAKEGDKHGKLSEMEQHIKKQARKVEKLQESIEGRINNRVEL